MAKLLKKKSEVKKKFVRPPKPEEKLEIDIGDYEISVRKTGYYWDDWPSEEEGRWEIDYDGGTIFSCYVDTEPSCCGFNVLTGFESYSSKEMSDVLVQEVGTKINAYFLKKKKVYFSAYLPDQKGYDIPRKIIAAAGFKPGAVVKSKHGKYTNTRWEWFGPTYGKEKGVKYEKAVRTIEV